MLIESRKVLLFDVDGTLIATGGAGGRAMARTARELFGIDAASISVAGRTDSWIVRQLAESAGYSCDSASVARFRQRYLAHLEIEMRAGAKEPLAGVRALLDRLNRRADLWVALLTGNFRRGAEIKLAHFGIESYCRGGAFGDDDEDRRSLLPIALSRVAAEGGPHALPQDTIVVGDTPHDVDVALSNGARAIGIATGPFSVEELRAAGAQAVLEDLRDYAAFAHACGFDPKIGGAAT